MKPTVQEINTAMRNVTNEEEQTVESMILNAAINLVDV